MQQKIWMPLLKERTILQRRPSLANDPKILLADEPTGNLESASSEEIIQTFERLNKEGRTVILVTHDKNIADAANIIYHMKDGEILADE